MITPANPFFHQQWHLKVIKAGEAWQLLRDHSGTALGDPDDLTFGSARIFLAIIDTGLQTEYDALIAAPPTGRKIISPAFEGNVSNGNPKGAAFYDFSVDDGAGVFRTDNNDVILGSHGMQCGGIAAARADFGIYQGANVVGVAPNCPVIGIVAGDFYGQFLWLLDNEQLNNSFNLFPANQRLQDQLPTGQTDVISLSISYNPSPANKADFLVLVRQIGFSLTTFGRGGRGIFIVVSAGNNSSKASDNQALTETGYYNVVGATTLLNNAAAPFLLLDEIHASYSNYGEEVWTTAPGGDRVTGQDAYQIFTAAAKDGGTFDDTPHLNIVLENASSTVNGWRFDVTSPGGVNGLFKGQHLIVGDPDPAANDQFEIRRIIKVDQAANQIWIEKFSFRSRSDINNLPDGLPAGVAAKFTHLNNTDPNPNSTTINVNNSQGFQVGQKIFIGDTSGSSDGESATVTGINGTELNLATPLSHHPYPADTPVICGEIRAQLTGDAANVDRQYFTVSVDNPTGFFVGQQILLNGTLLGPAGTSPGQTSPLTNHPSEVSAVKIASNELDILKPGGNTDNWTALQSGTIIEGIGYGDYDSGFTGTSAATPVVAGAAALLYSVNPNLSWLEVKHLLESTAEKIDLPAGGADTCWRDDQGERLFDGFGSFKTEISGKDLGGTANQGDTQITVSPDTNGFLIGMAVRIGDTFAKEFAVISGMPGGNVLELDRPLSRSYNAGKNVKGGRIPHHSGYYGYGRICLEKAVQAAIDYRHDGRDLMIRDTVSDLGVNPTTDPVDSPDIWVRNVRPDLDGGDAIPPSDNQPRHQNPNVDGNRWIYVRIKNRGDTYPGLAGAQIRLSLFYTLNPPDAPAMSFPKDWTTDQQYSSGGIVIREILFLTPNVFANELTDRYEEKAYTDPPESSDRILFANPDVSQADWRQPHLLPPIEPGDDYIAIIPWKEDRLSAHPQLDYTFLRVHLTPFDGELAGSSVADNHHLTYKEIVFSRIRLLDPAAAAGTELTEVEVNVSGTVLMRDITVEFTQLEPGAVDRIEITATMQFADGTPDETAVFSKISGSWTFDSTPPWLVLDSPTLSGAGAPFQETTHFGGTLALSNAHTNLTLHVKTTEASGSTLLEREMTVAVKPVIPRNAGGIGRQQTLVMQTFTDFDLLPAQSGADNFGPVSETQFRTSAMFSGIAGSATQLKAYAMAPGWACLREVDGEPDLLNLIFKPDKQHYIPYGKVKYFIYRGLKKSGFLDASGDVLDSAAADNELLLRMWEVRDRLNDDERALDPGFVDIPLTPADLGIGTLDDQTPIDEVFDTLTFQRITQGSHIGDFETDPSKEYGLTVIVDSSAYTPVLADAQSLDHLIKISYDAGQPEYANNEQEDIKTKLQREQILSYLDPAAYFGLQGMDKIDLVETTGVTSLQSADDTYSQLLVKFATRDKLYVDIRNELNYSLNFYGNYGDATAPHDSNVQFLDASGTTVTRTYGALGWPVLILDQSDFPANGTDEVLPLQLSLPVGDNNDPVLYLEGTSFLDDFPDNRLKFRFLTPSGNYTDAFDLGILNNPAQSVIMPGAVKIHHCRRYDTGNLPPVSFPADRVVKNDLLDTLLVQNSLPVTPTPGAVVWNSHSELRYNGWTSHRGIDYTLQTGSARDDIGQVLFACVKGPAEVDGHTTEAQTHSSLDIDKGKYLAGSFYQYLFNRKVIKPIDIQNIERSSEGNIDCPRILSVKAGFEIDIFQRSANDLITFAFTEAQRTTIEGLLSDFLPGSTRYFVLINHRLTNDDNGFPYYEMELGIQGIDYDDSTFTHEIIRTNTGIWFYSLDGRNYFSEDYTAALDAQLPYSTTP